MKLYSHNTGPLLLANTTTLGTGQTLPALTSLATRDTNGNAWLIVVNQDPESSVTATVQPQNLAHGTTAAVETLWSPSITDENSPSAPTTVQLADTNVNVGTSSFQYTFPAHSIVAFHLMPQ